MKSESKLFLACLGATFLTVAPACAWSLFGSSASNAAGRLKSADRLLEKADAAFEEGNVEAAARGYAHALDKYRVINSNYPEFNDGIAAIRIEYCEGQLAECGETQAHNPLGTKVDTSDAEAPDSGKSAVAASVPNVQNSNAKQTSPTTAAASSSDAASRNSGTDSDKAADAFRTITGETAPATPAADNADDPATQVAYNPRYFAYDFGEARELIEKGQHDDAIEILLPMVKFDPDNRQLRMLLATARIGAGQPELAIATLEDLRGRREDLPLLLLIAGAYTSAGRYPDALLALDTAAKLAPGEPDAFSNLAWLTLLMEGDTAESREIAGNYYRQSLKRGAARNLAIEAALGIK